MKRGRGSSIGSLLFWFAILPLSSLCSAQPVPPSPVTVTPGSGEAWIAWGPSPGALSYNVYSSNNGTYSKIASGLTTFAYLNTGLTNGIDYSFYVTAVNASGESIPSFTVDITPGTPNTYLPVFPVNGVTNAASFSAGATPGSIVTIFGTHLSTNLTGIVSATQLPLPGTLSKVSVLVGGVLAPLFAVVKSNITGQEQINLQIPWQFAGQSSVPVVVNNGTTISAIMTIPLSTAQPGIFILDGSRDGFLHADNAIVTTSRPAQPGEEITAYLTGMGPVTTAPPSGSPGPGTTTLPPTVDVSGAGSAQVKFSGLSSQFVGLYQVNFVVPPAASSGAHTVTISVNGVSSNSANLQVQ